MSKLQYQRFLRRRFRKNFPDPIYSLEDFIKIRKGFSNWIRFFLKKHQPYLDVALYYSYFNKYTNKQVNSYNWQFRKKYFWRRDIVDNLYNIDTSLAKENYSFNKGTKNIFFFSNKSVFFSKCYDILIEMSSVCGFKRIKKSINLVSNLVFKRLSHLYYNRNMFSDLKKDKYFKYFNDLEVNLFFYSFFLRHRINNYSVSFLFSEYTHAIKRRKERYWLFSNKMFLLRNFPKYSTYFRYLTVFKYMYDCFFFVKKFTTWYSLSNKELFCFSSNLLKSFYLKENISTDYFVLVDIFKYNKSLSFYHDLQKTNSLRDWFESFVKKKVLKTRYKSLHPKWRIYKKKHYFYKCFVKKKVPLCFLYSKKISYNMKSLIFWYFKHKSELTWYREKRVWKLLNRFRNWDIDKIISYNKYIISYKKRIFVLCYKLNTFMPTFSSSINTHFTRSLILFNFFALYKRPINISKYKLWKKYLFFKIHLFCITLLELEICINLKSSFSFFFPLFSSYINKCFFVFKKFFYIINNIIFLIMNTFFHKLIRYKPFKKFKYVKRELKKIIEKHRVEYKERLKYENTISNRIKRYKRRLQRLSNPEKDIPMETLGVGYNEWFCTRDRVRKHLFMKKRMAYINNKKRTNELLTFFWPKYKNLNYISWYNLNFERNYKNIVFILKCYYDKSSKLLFSWKDFIIRQRSLFRYNFFYRAFLKSSVLLPYSYFFRKKLHTNYSFSLISRSSFLYTSYIRDSSLLFYDRFLNYNYTSHIDEKYSFYLKNLLFRRVSSGINTSFKSLFLKKNMKQNRLKNIHFIFRNKYTMNYKKLFYFLFFNCYTIKNKMNNYFFSFICLKYNIFILKNGLYYFFKEFFVHKFKYSIYSLLFKNTKNIMRKGDYWLDSFRFRLFKKNKTLYKGINDLRNINAFHILLYKNTLLNINYMDWFIYVKKAIYTKYSFFNEYKKHYKYFYTKKLLFYKKKDMVRYVKDYIQKNREHIITRTKKWLHSYNKHFFFFSKKKDDYKFLKMYTDFLILNINKFPNNFFSLKKKYKNYNFKKKYLSKLVSSYCKYLLLNSFYKKKYSSNLLQYINSDFDIFLENKKKVKKEDISKMSSNVLSNYIVNKKTTVFFRFIMVMCLYEWKLTFRNNRKNIKNIKNIKIIKNIKNIKNKKRKKFPTLRFFNLYYNTYGKKFLMYYYLFKYFNVREKMFNNFLNNYKHFILKGKSGFNLIKSVKVTKSYRKVGIHSRVNSFYISNYSNIYIFFFLFLKQVVLHVFLNNSFSIYKKRILIHSFKNNFLFLRNSFFQFDYVINTFLNTEIDILILKE